MTEKTNVFRKFLKPIRPNRKYKDRLFLKVFSDRKDLLELYNAVNGTAYTNSEDLEITTIDDVIYLSMKNDISFIVSSTLNLYEHQSTINPNMPLRGLFYFSRLYDAYIVKHQLDIYGHKKLNLPAPQFIIFYNGQEYAPDATELRLSDLFSPVSTDAPTQNSVLECTARLLNINNGHNKKLLDSCTRLHDYALFIAEVRQNLGGECNLEDAIEQAINTCIEKNILADILLKQKSEVFHMLLTEYDPKKQRKFAYKEGFEDGIESGCEKGAKLKLISLVCRKLQKESHRNSLQKNSKNLMTSLPQSASQLQNVPRITIQNRFMNL